MIVAFSVYVRDEANALATLSWAYALDGKLPYDCILSLGYGVKEKPILAACEKLFRSVRVKHSDAPDTWPQGKNGSFQSLVRYLDTHKIRESFLWLEPDSVFLKKGAIQAIEREHIAGGKPFTGFVNEALGGNKHMECVGVYPPNFMDYSIPTMLARAASWDRCMVDIVSDVHRINHLLQFVHEDSDGFLPTFPKNLNLLRPGAVLFHRNKDGSLVEHLSKGKIKIVDPVLEGGIVSLRRAGDIISLLPLVRRIAEKAKRKVKVIVHSDFMPVLEGASYVQPLAWNGEWEDPLAAANELNAVNAQVYGRNVRVNGGKDFVQAAWQLVGHTWNRYFPLAFDKRDAKREAALAETVFKNGHPKVLLKFHGFSSPFTDGEAVWAAIASRLGDRAEIVNLDDVKAERIYDLLGLMDRAACLVSVDTSALHLAQGSHCPVIALVNNLPFTSTPAKGNCLMRVNYSDVTTNLERIARKVEDCIAPTRNEEMVLVHFGYTPTKPETVRREKTARATWGFLGARLLAFQPTRTAKQVGDEFPAPFIRDMIQAAFAGAEDICVICNNDIAFDPALREAILESCREYGCYWAYRTSHAGGPTDYGADVFAFTRRWWGMHEHQFPDLLLGYYWWDDLLIRMMVWSGCLEQPRLYYHEPHGYASPTRQHTVGARYNVNTAAAWLAANGERMGRVTPGLVSAKEQG